MILLIINNLFWIIFLYLLYKDLRKGLSSPKFDIVVNLFDDKGKQVKSIVTNAPVESPKKDDELEETQELESLVNVPFQDVVASLEKEMKNNKKKR